MKKYIKDYQDTQILNIHLSDDEVDAFVTEKIGQYQQFINQYGNYLKQIQSTKISNKSTEKRFNLLEKLTQTNSSYFIKLKSKLQEVSQIEVVTPEDPSTESPMDPIPTLNRDWGEGFMEVELEKEKCLKNFKLKSIDSALFLGAGSCHLVSALTREWRIKESLALDTSFELLLSYSLLKDKMEIEVAEEVISPESVEQSICFKKLSTPEKSNLSLIHGDFLTTPFIEKSFSMVMSPWFLDITNSDLNWNLLRINQLLEEKGQFLFMGPLGFQSPLPQNRYSPQELIEEAKKAGLKLISFNSESIPYRQLPGVGRKVSETIHFMNFEKTEHLSPVDNPYLIDQYISSQEPLPLTSQINRDFLQMNIRVQIFMFLNGINNFQEVQKKYEELTKTPPGSGAETIRNFLKNYYT